MFLEFQKLTNNSLPTEIIVNVEELLTIDFNNFEMNGEIVNATHIEIGNPKYQFYTTSSVANIEAALNVIDITAGYVPGYICAGGTTASIIAPTSSFPMIELKEIHNNTMSETRDIIINPSKILYTENVNFIDSVSSVQVTSMMIVMTDSNRTRFITNLTYAEIFAILEPTVVA